MLVLNRRCVVGRGAIRSRPLAQSFAMSRAWSESPNPSWKIGDKIERPLSHSNFREIDTELAEPSALYKMLTSGIVPRPIAFVSSLSADGIPNLAPFSYFQMLTHDPPLLMVSVNNKNESERKDTAANVLATKEFAVNIISDDFVEGANITSVDAPFEIDEWALSGLTRADSSVVKPARVAESAFSMECTLYNSMDIPTASSAANSTTLIIGHIKRIHVREDVLSPKGDTVDAFKLQAVMRLGGIQYGKFTEGYTLSRPRWSQMKGDIEAVISKNTRDKPSSL